MLLIVEETTVGIYILSDTRKNYSFYVSVEMGESNIPGLPKRGEGREVVFKLKINTTSGVFFRHVLCYVKQEKQNTENAAVI